MLKPKRRYAHDELDRYTKAEQSRYWDERTVYRSRVISRFFQACLVVVGAILVMLSCNFFH